MRDTEPLWKVMRNAYWRLVDTSTPYSPPENEQWKDVLTALANQMMPDEPKPFHPSPELFAARIDLGRWIERQSLRKQLLAEADRAEAGR